MSINWNGRLLRQTISSRRKTRRVSKSSLGFERLESRQLLAPLSFYEFRDPNPNDGNGFGAVVVPLETGNVVISSPFDDAGGEDAGAVYLFNGSTGELISTLTGSSANDRIGGGAGGVEALPGGNFVIRSPEWNNGSAPRAGAVTFGNGTTGVSGVVTSDNSLVGTSAFDKVGEEDLIVLDNGNYLVASPNWDNGSEISTGAVTFGSRLEGVAGAVDSTNSLVGSSAGDGVGSSPYLSIMELANSNYLVGSPAWDNGSVFNAGAVTFGDGSNGVSGVVGEAISLVGVSTNDRVGTVSLGRFARELQNGNYVVLSPFWDNGGLEDVGAVTFGNVGLGGAAGEISITNSLIGSTPEDSVGSESAVLLQNSNFVIRSPDWDNGDAIDAGAVTFISGTDGLTGEISATNSLVGTSPGDAVGNGVVTPLKNGNYVVHSSRWDNGPIIDAGAATFGDATQGGAVGAINIQNSLVGSRANDFVGRAHALENGNYVVTTSGWDSGTAIDVGAVTFGDGTSGVFGFVSESNSLVGSTSGDRVGTSGIVSLETGNYLIRSPLWNNGTASKAGAVTFGNGVSGISGVLSDENSLVGSSTDDQIGTRFSRITAIGPSGIQTLPGGNYLVSSPLWDNGSAVSAGAVTFGDGETGVSGVISAGNSLVGLSTEDFIGFEPATILDGGNYILRAPIWDRGSVVDAGAVTFGDGQSGVVGVIDSTNSLVGSSHDDQVGGGGVRVLNNGNYVVGSQVWDNGTLENAGAATFGDGATGVSGTISSENSLVGTSTGQRVGFTTALSNGDYVVGSQSWRDDSGLLGTATTFGNGTTGGVGTVTPTNSLIALRGENAFPSDRVDLLADGDYALTNRRWDRDGVSRAAAVTYGDASEGGATGFVSPENALVGTAPLDSISDRSPIVFENGNYLVLSTDWDNGSRIDAGAITFVSAQNGSTVGDINPANSFLGASFSANRLLTVTNSVGFPGVVVDDFNSNFYVRSEQFTGSGRVRVGSQVTGIPAAPSDTPPVVISTRIDTGGVLARPDQWQTFKVAFDRDVNVTAEAFSLFNESEDGVVVDLSSASFDYEPASFTATWTFDSANPLRAGYYTYHLDASSISADGFQLDGNSDGTDGDDITLQHYVALPGDANLNGEVDVLSDAREIVENLGQTNPFGVWTWADGDFTGDGKIDLLNDAFAFISGLGQSVSSPAAAATADVAVAVERNSLPIRFAFNTVGPVALAAPTPNYQAQTDVEAPLLTLTGSQKIDHAFESFSDASGVADAASSIARLDSPTSENFEGIDDLDQLEHVLEW